MRLLLPVLLLAVVGCARQPTRAITSASQTPGTAQGAGATITSPVNASAPSTQVAERRVAYYPPVVEAKPVLPIAVAPIEQAVVQNAPIQPTTSPTLTPAWIDEKVTTTIAPHQDAAAILKSTNFLASWSKLRWLGLCLVIAGIAGLLWSHNNPDGYPLICWKVLVIGSLLIIFNPSPWWLLTLLLPAGLYVMQKLNLLRLP